MIALLRITLLITLVLETGGEMDAGRSDAETRSVVLFACISAVYAGIDAMCGATADMHAADEDYGGVFAEHKSSSSLENRMYILKNLERVPFRLFSAITSSTFL